jgi:protein-S-isoprenylcysteine O-methyltransferase Ste14
MVRQMFAHGDARDEFGLAESSMLDHVLRNLSEFRRTKSYDLVTATPLIAWYLLALVRQMPLTWIRVADLVQGRIGLLDFLQLLALAGSFVLIFVLMYLLVVRRTPERRMQGVWPRLVAVGGTFLGNAILLLEPVRLSLLLQITADLLIISGAAGSLIAVSWLGRSFALMPEARQLVTNGPYALIRHPLYAAEMIGIAGLMLQFKQPWAVILGGLVFALQYWRTVFEERVLQEAYPKYGLYRARTWRFVPYVF